MNDYKRIHLRSGCLFFSFTLYVCNHNDNNVLFKASLIRTVYPWAANLTFLKISLIKQRYLFATPMMRMSSEKRKRFFCPLDLVLIWSLLELSLDAPKPPSAASSPSFVPTVLPLMWLPESAAGADARICPLNRKPDCLNRFSKRRVKELLLWWPTYAKPMKQLLAGAFRLPQSIGCWLATAGNHSVRLVAWTQAKGYPYERLGPIICIWLSPAQSEFGLDHNEPNPSRFCPCRSCIGASGGYC